MTDDIERLLEEIAAAQELADLAELEHRAACLIDELAARFTDMTRERREVLLPPP